MEKGNLIKKASADSGLDAVFRKNGHREFSLSARLSAIAAMVTAGNRLADVGCDHGYLSIFLVQNGTVPSAIAMDVRPGPLGRAKEHITQAGLSDSIETRLSDGLDALASGEADTLVIAGMGGPLMERILTKGAAVRDSFSELILQPQSDIPHFRHYIRSQGWEVVQEELILEDGKFYPMMKGQKASFRTNGAIGACLQFGETDISAESRKSVNSDSCGCIFMPVWSREEEAFGKLLLDSRHPVLREYLLREERIQREIIARLADSTGEAAAARRAEVQEEMQMIEKALSLYNLNDGIPEENETY